MLLKNVSFAAWLRGHAHKDPEERWLRELYPWPVLAQVDCDRQAIGIVQQIICDDVEYAVTLRSVEWQAKHGTFRYRLLVESDGLGWHSRSFSDEFDMCGASDGSFITVFHVGKEPLERVAKAFFSRRWSSVSARDIRTLAVSRFLAATIAVQVAEEAFPEQAFAHYPAARLAVGSLPLLASDDGVWVGHRFYSENAYEWVRQNAGRASQLVALYFADTKYQFRRDLPPGTEVHSIAELDATALGGRYEDLIRALLRGLSLPTDERPFAELQSIVTGRATAPILSVTESDVHEALASLKFPCDTKAELRYQLAAAVVLNAWIEEERRLGFVQRKRFYAFKQRVAELMRWAVDAKLSGVSVWVSTATLSAGPILLVRIDDVDFSFHAIPSALEIAPPCGDPPTWSGIRLKPIAPIVLAWARALRRRG